VVSRFERRSQARWSDARASGSGPCLGSIMASVPSKIRVFNLQAPGQPTRRRWAQVVPRGLSWAQAAWRALAIRSLSRLNGPCSG
jgi:hypothetical protein